MERANYLNSLLRFTPLAYNSNCSNEGEILNRSHFRSDRLQRIWHNENKYKRGHRSCIIDSEQNDDHTFQTGTSDRDVHRRKHQIWNKHRQSTNLNQGSSGPLSHYTVTGFCEMARDLE